MAQADLLIKQATIADAEAIAAIINNAYRGKSGMGWTTEAALFEGNRITPAELSDIMQQPDTAIFKCSDTSENLLGSVLFQLKGSALYLGLLAINPVMQNAGIGRRLLEYGEAYARGHGCTSIDITVVNVRQELIDWYIRRGYVATGKQHPFPPAGGKATTELCLVEMIKHLDE